MGMAIKNGCFEVSFSCLHESEFQQRSHTEALAGLITQITELSVTLSIKETKLHVVLQTLPHSSAI